MDWLIDGERDRLALGLKLGDRLGLTDGLALGLSDGLRLALDD